MNLDLGTSIAYGHNDASDDSSTRLFGVDATFRYRPLRRAIYRRFIGRTELVWSRREQPAPDFTAKSFGYYASGEYQFARRWFSGASLGLVRARHECATSTIAALVSWSRSGPASSARCEGSTAGRRTPKAVTANEFLFQFLFAIGAHGAHTF